MPKGHRPKHGSWQFYPRKRAKRIYPRVRSWAKKPEVKILGFAGYKVGMTHCIVQDIKPTSITKNTEIAWPTTIIECPPLNVFSLRFYKKAGYGSIIIKDVIADKFDKELKRKINIPKKKDIKQEFPTNFDDVRILVHANPKLTTIGKKKPEVIELALSGNKDEKLNFAKNLLGKEIKLSDIFKQGEFVDIHAVTTGKGFQGPVKRFGVNLKSHKSEKKRRSAGNMGPSIPRKVHWKVPQHGQLGFFSRTQYNNLIVAINPDKPENMTKEGFRSYGIVKNDFALVRGSIPGPKKRFIQITHAIRKSKPDTQFEVKFIKK
ncbi:MAG: 50S ribosomal protein L3 [Candidatus Nanoarchaeia archaeon]